MRFPLAITKTIILKQDEFGISSERYLLNHISNYMEKFGLMKKRISDNELFYIKMDPIKAFRRKDFIRNIQIIVECDNDTIKVKLRTETILLFIVSLGMIGAPFVVPDFPFLLIIPMLLLFCVLPYAIKLWTLNQFK